MKADDLLTARFRELAERSWHRDILQHTDFLGVSEQAAFHELAGSLAGARYILYGGHPEADRQMLIFLPSYLELPREGSPEAEGILSGMFSDLVACIRISPLNEKFSDALTHRDYLGALMNLGIQRDKTGDILTEGSRAWLYCSRDIAELVCRELTRVKHTSVSCEEVPPGEAEVRPKFQELSVNVASERLDAVLAAVYKLSRGAAAELIAGEKVFVDGRTAGKTGGTLREGARISVRGYGKFIYDGREKETRKGRLYIRVRVFL